MNTENYTASQQALIASVSAAITERAGESIVAIVTIKASMARFIREQVAILTKAKIADKDIATIVRDAIGSACAPSTISRTLTECGIRLRGKRSDAGHLRSADALLNAALEAKPAKPAAADEDGEGEGEGDEVECLVEDGTGGHTAETLAALLKSVEVEVIADALEIAGLTDARSRLWNFIEPVIG
jgi:hypothetical protein